MADKAEFVDMISEATKQVRRRTTPVIVDVKPVAKETSRLSHWPPEHWAHWRMTKLTPWKVKEWEAKDW